jgi:hypothetical protein
LLTAARVRLRVSICSSGSVRKGLATLANDVCFHVSLTNKMTFEL